MATTQFGPFTLDVVEWRLTRDGVVVDAQAKALELLAVLLERPGRLWRREELHARVWPGVFVSEDSLFQAMRKLRQALGDPPRAPVWIETVPGQGYRFLGAQPGATRAPAARVPAAPPPTTSLVGRGPLVQSLVAALEARPGTWTLTGPGGVGKTRLAREVLHQVDLPGVFVDLQAATSADAIEVAAARALAAGGAVGDALQALGPCVVVVDNAEQVVTAVAASVVAWRAAAPEVRFLVTSRIRLGLVEEALIEVPLLSLPPRDATVEGLRAHAASRLLLDRAAAAAGFTPTPEETVAIAELVALLGGLPLAIELAAPRLRVLRPSQLLARAGSHLDLLAGAGPDRPGRHASLRAAIGTSWGLLGPELRVAMARLAPLPGPFGFELADTLLGGRGPELLGELVDHSLVRRREGGLFEILPSIRDFVAEQAAAEPDVVGLVVAWYAAGRPDAAPDDVVRLARDEAANLMFAFEAALAASKPEVAARVLRNLAPTFLAHGPIGELLRLLRRVHARDPEAAWLTLLEAEACLLTEEARTVGPRLDSLAGRLTDDPAADAQRITLELDLAFVQGRLEPALRRVEATAAHPGLTGVARVRWCCAAVRVLTQNGRLDEAEQRVLEGLAIASAPGFVGLHATLLIERANLEIERGDFRLALATLDEASGRIEAAPDRRAGTRALERKGMATFRNGSIDEAETLVAEAMRQYRRAGNVQGELICLELLGRVMQKRGDSAAGLRLLREAAALAQRLGFIGAEAVVRGNVGSLLGTLGRLDEAEAELTRALALQEAYTIRSPITLHNLGALAVARGDLDLARTRYQAALAGHLASGNRRSAALTRGALGELELLAGRFLTAIAVMAEALPILQEVGDRQSVVQVGQRLATAYAKAGDVGRAEALFDEVLATCRTSALREHEASARIRWARAALERGDVALARSRWEAANAMVRAFNPSPAPLVADLAGIAAELGVQDARPEG